MQPNPFLPEGILAKEAEYLVEKMKDNPNCDNSNADCKLRITYYNVTNNLLKNFQMNTCQLKVQNNQKISIPQN